MLLALFNVTATIKKGGIEIFNLGLAKKLMERGINIHFYGGLTDKNVENFRRTEFFMFPFIPRNKFPDFGSRFRKFMERLSFAYYALPTLKNFKYDFFCIFKPYDLLIAWYVKKLSNCKTIFFSGGTEFFPGYKKLLKKVDYLFACSEFNAKQIEEYTGIKPLVLPYAIDTELFKPQIKDISLKEELGINNEIVIITVCRLVGWKGVQYSIKAIGKLIKEGYFIKYLIIGDGEEKENLEKLASDLNITKNVIFLGSINNTNLPKYYSIADIAVFPSIANETFGISIAEAMACGVPVISTNVGGIPEVVANAGFLVPPKNEISIADKIKFLIENPAIKQEISIRGRNRIVEKFSWDKILNKFLEYINA